MSKRVPTFVEVLDEYVQSFPLALCRHGDVMREECPICLFESDHECDFDDDTITVATEART